MTVELLNCDCMEYMATQPDNAFDLAIVDPPYGIKRDKGLNNDSGGSGFYKTNLRKRYKQEWDNERPKRHYFDELLRVSRDQIIWGGNYFADLVPVNGHWLFWDKVNTMPTFSDGELAWTSIKRTSVKQVTIESNGLLGKEITRIHPTQKPVKLYQWLLKTYAKPGQRILDTHLGSGSSAIAAHYFGCDFVGCEIDKDYYDAAVNRFNNETKQQAMF